MVEAKVGVDPDGQTKVAVVQAEPCWFDVDAAIAKTCDLMREASQNGAKLIAFPELWIPGYPNFIHALNEKDAVDYIRRYYRNSVEVDSTHMATLRRCARDNDIMAVVGISERQGGSLYMAQTFVGPDGSILLHRRKFKPTAYERVIFGDASGDCTRNVVQTPIGRVGGLQCFEHLQPLLKYNTYAQGEQIHVASWPNLFGLVGDMPWFNTVHSCRMETHTYAVESGSFVLLASHTQSVKGLVANGMTVDDLSEDAEAAPHTAVVGGGFSVIIGPDGRPLTDPVPDTWEGIIYHEIDFNDIYVAKATVDPVGQYSRPDIFTLQVRSKVHKHVEIDGIDEGLPHAARFLWAPGPTLHCQAPRSRAQSRAVEGGAGAGDGAEE